MSFPIHKLAAPFPWFGGKVMQSDMVWAALHDVSNFVEPFAGSIGVLLNRPLPFAGTETVNDTNGHLVNFWRAVKSDPDAVAEHADNVVASVDLWARHDWLIANTEPVTGRLIADPEWFDAKVAGWWVWGLCCWIGSGWCARPRRQRIHTGNAGMGVNAATSRQRIHTGDAGMGEGSTAGAGLDWTHQSGLILERMQALAERLRRVRVLCGDWKQAVQFGVIRGSKVGIYLDPPYAHSVKRDTGLYGDQDDGSVSAEVRQWCIENGENPRLRIVLAGYDGEHVLPGWREVAWKVHGHGYASQSHCGPGAKNVTRERLWLSPHCIVAEFAPGERGGAVSEGQPGLFEGAE